MWCLCSLPLQLHGPVEYGGSAAGLLADFWGWVIKDDVVSMLFARTFVLRILKKFDYSEATMLWETQATCKGHVYTLCLAGLDWVILAKFPDVHLNKALDDPSP